MNVLLINCLITVFNLMILYLFLIIVFFVMNCGVYSMFDSVSFIGIGTTD